MIETLNHLAKTAEQELNDVMYGSKPAALGFWDYDELCKCAIYVQELLPVYGRYYKYAIAGSKEDLARLVMAYYLPISANADRAVGEALGYSKIAITLYLNHMKYKKRKKVRYLKHLFLKSRSSIQKIGWTANIMSIIGLLCGDKVVKIVLKKEGIL